MEPITTAQLRSDFADIIARTYYQNKTFIISKSNKPMAVLISPEEYELLLGEKPDPSKRRK
ncbi:MAG TPA: type II toxin-antitoxin system prevent-host-death family antitoxin [bacterium]|nr:type II toxin-antitoxin system prevent-host-death family antitoxin [bacterium]